MLQRPNPSHRLFLYSPQAKDASHFLTVRKKRNKRWTLLWHKSVTQITWKCNCSDLQVLREDGHTHSWTNNLGLLYETKAKVSSSDRDLITCKDSLVLSGKSLPAPALYKSWPSPSYNLNTSYSIMYTYHSNARSLKKDKSNCLYWILWDNLYFKCPVLIAYHLLMFKECQYLSFQNFKIFRFPLAHGRDKILDQRAHAQFGLEIYWDCGAPYDYV